MCKTGTNIDHIFRKKNSWTPR